MSPFWDIFQTGVIGLIFCVCGYVNRCRRFYHKSSGAHEDLYHGYYVTPEGLVPVRRYNRKGPLAVVGLFHHFYHSYPFIQQVFYWFLLFWPYEFLRDWAADRLAGDAVGLSNAQFQASGILRVESRFGVSVELPMQKRILDSHPFVIPYLAFLYNADNIFGAAFIAYAYTFFGRRTYHRVFRTLAVIVYITLITQMVTRVAGPRLLAAEFGFQDVLFGTRIPDSRAANYIDSQLTTDMMSRLSMSQLRLDTMPSLRLGTSLFYGEKLCRFSPHRFVRILALVYPIAMIFTLLTTGNSFLLDVVCSDLAPQIAWRINEVVTLLAPVQAWVFSPLTRYMYPAPTANQELPLSMTEAFRKEGVRLVKSEGDGVGSRISPV